MIRRRRVDSRSRSVAIGLGWARIGIGALALGATRPSVRALGLSREPGGALTAVARLVGTRDIAMGGLALGALDDRRALRTVVATNAAVDAADAATFLVPLLRRQGIDRPALFSVGTAAAASAANLWLASRLAQC